MPCAGHFICGHMCRFRMNTHVNGYIVSTVGQYAPSHVFENGEIRMRRDSDPCEEIGHNRMYETMVFKARPTRWREDTKPEDRCCPFEAVDGDSLDFAAYSHAGDAFAGHMVMLDKWSVAP